MAATSRPPAPSRPRARDAWAHVVAPIVVLVVGLVVSALAQHAADSASRAHSLADFLEVARDHEAQITRRLRDDEQIVLGAAGLFQVLPAVGRDDFRRYVAALRVRESYPGIQAVAFVRAVPGGERAAFVDEVRRADDPGFHLWPERAGEDAATLLYVEPGDDQTQLSPFTRRVAAPPAAVAA
jgi:CHASE1-domain containing sensor protein